MKDAFRAKPYRHSFPPHELAKESKNTGMFRLVQRTDREGLQEADMVVGAFGALGSSGTVAQRRREYRLANVLPRAPDLIDAQGWVEDAA